MNPRTRSLVSLAVIAVCAVATVVAWRLRPPPLPPPAASNKPVFDFAPSTVRAIDVRSWQGELRAERRDAGWQVTALRNRRSASAERDPGATTPGGPTPTPLVPPTAAQVNEAMIELVREVVDLPVVDRFARDGRPLAEFGLEKPEATFDLELDSGTTRRLEVGNTTITGTALYARAVPPDDVIEIGSLLFNTFDATLYRLRGLGTVGRQADGPPASPS